MRFVAFILLLNTNILFAQTGTNVKSFTLHSNILKEDRFFEIYVPPSSNNKSEVIYVLDGQALFSTVLNILKSNRLNDKIVVGIGNIWMRDRDYTPTKIQSPPFVDSTAAKISGGGENFIAHLEKEVIPYVNEHYPAGNSRVLIGHSLGGLIAMDIFLKHTDLFSKYAAIDPSMWWDGGKLLVESRELLKKSFPKISLFVAIANTYKKDKPDIEAIKRDTTVSAALIRPSTILLDYLKQAAIDNLTYSWKYYKDAEHMNVFEPAANDALRFLLQ
jgi:predicted alpha/beta superfamily hydrolase